MGSNPTSGTKKAKSVKLKTKNYFLIMKNNPIGILDSGVGGLTVLTSIVQELSHESVIYIGDSQNTPYGKKTEEEIYPSFQNAYSLSSY